MTPSPLDQEWLVGATQHRFARAAAGGAKKRRPAQRRYHRQPKREVRGHHGVMQQRLRCRQKNQRAQRHIFTDTQGLLAGVVITPVSVQDTQAILKVL